MPAKLGASDRVDELVPDRDPVPVWELFGDLDPSAFEFFSVNEYHEFLVLAPVGHLEPRV